jgi:hypothetical protein
MLRCRDNFTRNWRNGGACASLTRSIASNWRLA